MAFCTSFLSSKRIVIIFFLMFGMYEIWIYSLYTRMMLLNHYQWKVLPLPNWCLSNISFCTMIVLMSGTLGVFWCNCIFCSMELLLRVKLISSNFAFTNSVCILTPFLFPSYCPFTPYYIQHSHISVYYILK